MEPTKYIWMNGKFVSWKNAKVHVLTHALHYGTGVLEGMRVYDTDRGPAIRTLKDHVRRLFSSAKALQMKIPFSELQLREAIVDLVRKNKLKKGYIRPLAFFGYGKMGLRVQGAPVDLAIACWPWAKYLSENPIKVKTSRLIRIHPDSCTISAKVTGYYVTSAMAVNDVVGAGCDEALFLDYRGRVAEGPGANFFIVKKGVLITPKCGTILEGITRRTVIDIAQGLGMKVIEKVLSLSEALAADEAFFTGTAAEITPIGWINGNKVGSAKTGPVTEQLRTSYMDVLHGRHFLSERLMTWVD